MSDMRSKRAKETHLVQFIQHRNCGFPIHTRIGNAHTPLQGRRPFFGHVLSARIDMALYHDASNVPFARSKLGTDGINDLGLVVVVLLGVSVCMLS